MKKLRNVLAAALLTIPVLTLNAGTLAEATGTELRPTRTVTACCTVYYMGRYWCVPC